jgi:hypothetical protein
MLWEMEFEMNENGELFINLCASYDLVIGGSLFIQKKKVTKSQIIAPKTKQTT